MYENTVCQMNEHDKKKTANKEEARESRQYTLKDERANHC